MEDAQARAVGERSQTVRAVPAPPSPERGSAKIPAAVEIPAPYDSYRDRVRPEWTDRNRHLNVGYYVLVFDFATDAWLDFVGLDDTHRAAHGISTFCLEGHIIYRREVAAGDPLRFTTQLLDFDAKRIHYIHKMYHAEAGFLSATNELLSLHVSQATRRSAPMAPPLLERLTAIGRAHAALPHPPEVGRTMGLRSPATTR